MSDLNLLGHIQSAIDRYFGFLKDYGFDRFQAQQLAYEYHFIASNKMVTIDLWFEAVISTPIWVRINDFYIGSLEPENAVLKDLAKKSELLLLPNRSFDDFICEENYERYRLFGKDLNDKYLQEVASILNRNPQVLNDDLSTLKANYQRQIVEIESEAADRKRQDKSYTCEFNSCFGECYYESKSIDEIKIYLQAQSLDVGIANIRLYDWDNNLVPFELNS
jgi:hypothetical protein